MIPSLISLFNLRRQGPRPEEPDLVSLCKKIIYDHGGTISVESETEGVTTFQVELPELPPYLSTRRLVRPILSLVLHLDQQRYQTYRRRRFSKNDDTVLLPCIARPVRMAPPSSP